MKFVANGVKYEFDDDRMTFAEARAIQKATGQTMGEIRKSPEDIVTVQATIWVAMKRQDPTLRFSDLDDMAIGDIEWIHEEDLGEEPADGDPPMLGDEPDGDSTPSE